MADLVDTVREIVKFRRKVAAELRDAATMEPHVALTLRQMADRCETEAKELSEQFGIGPQPSNSRLKHRLLKVACD
jgi:hypothetical protein